MRAPRCHFYSHFAAHKHPHPHGESPEAPQQLVGPPAPAQPQEAGFLTSGGRPRAGSWGTGLEALLKAGSTPGAIWGVGFQSLLITVTGRAAGAPEPRCLHAGQAGRPCLPRGTSPWGTTAWPLPAAPGPQVLPGSHSPGARKASQGEPGATEQGQCGHGEATGSPGQLLCFGPNKDVAVQERKRPESELFLKKEKLIIFYQVLRGPRTLSQTLVGAKRVQAQQSRCPGLGSPPAPWVCSEAPRPLSPRVCGLSGPLLALQASHELPSVCPFQSFPHLSTFRP